MIADLLCDMRRFALIGVAVLTLCLLPALGVTTTKLSDANPTMQYGQSALAIDGEGDLGHLVNSSGCPNCAQVIALVSLELSFQEPPRPLRATRTIVSERSTIAPPDTPPPRRVG